MRDPPGLTDMERAGVDAQFTRTLWRIERTAAEGTIALVKGDAEQARKSFDEAIHDAPDLFPPDAQLDRAGMFEKAGDRANAIAACNSAVAVDPFLDAVVKKRIAAIQRGR
jgi:Tfp pilus assembly protein PilF